MSRWMMHLDWTTTMMYKNAFLADIPISRLNITNSFWTPTIGLECRRRAENIRLREIIRPLESYAKPWITKRDIQASTQRTNGKFPQKRFSEVYKSTHRSCGKILQHLISSIRWRRTIVRACESYIDSILLKNDWKTKLRLHGIIDECEHLMSFIITASMNEKLYRL